MQDTTLYEQILGIQSPWSVSRVQLDVQKERVHVYVEHVSGVKFACPTCQRVCGVYDHSAERQWRHLDSCQYLTILHARPPRIECSEHGVLQASLPWAEGHGRFTSFFERLAIDVFKETSITGGCRILRLSWDEAWHILDKAVARGLVRKEACLLPHIGVDEKAIAKGHQYMTLVVNHEKRCVENVIEGRTIESLEAFYKALSKDQLHSIQSVSMDMWAAFDTATRTHVPEAATKIVYDPFHIVQHMNKAVDQVRRAEHKAWLGDYDESPLTKKRYLFLRNEEDITFKDRTELALMKKADLKTARAWALKENLRRLWQCGTKALAREHWQRWDRWASHSQLKPVVKVASMIRNHIDNILTYFDHRKTNALSEALNAVVQTVKRNARGIRNKVHFKTLILFHCGKLSLYPTTH